MGAKHSGCVCSPTAPLPVATATMATNSIFSQLEGSSYGTFQKLFDDLGLDVSGFTLPKVVVIGCESAGKSSTLESITKCEMFPRAKRICTKQPVRIDMTHAVDGETILLTKPGQHEVDVTKADLLRTLEAHMRSMSDIVDSELLLSISSPNVKTFTLVDLPGLRALPKQAAQATRAITDAYLADPTTLVVCVVPAAEELLLNVESIARVLEHGRQRQAILVLTKPDDVPAHLVGDRILDRVDPCAAAEEMRELGGGGFASCVCVMNRKLDDAVSLTEHDAVEAAFMEGLSDCERIRGRLGVPSLVRELDALYHARIVDTWKPRALDILMNESAAVQRDLELLGRAVETYGELKQYLIASMVDLPVWLYSLPELGTVFPIIPPQFGVAWGSFAWGMQVRESLPSGADVLARAKAFYKTDTERTLVTQLVSVFTTDDNVWKTARFGALRAEVIERFTKAYEAGLDAPEFKAVVAAAYDDYRRRVLRSGPCQERTRGGPAYDFLREEQEVFGHVCVHVLLPAIEQAFDLPSDAEVQEDDDVRARRTGLLARLAELEKGMAVVAGLV